jgi:hypothetical protein
MKRITKNFVKYLNTLGDADLLRLVQDISGTDTSAYIVQVRTKDLIRLTNHWDVVRVDEKGIHLSPYTPPYREYTTRAFDKYFCIPVEDPAAAATVVPG